jgi:hypothetical protein
LLTYFRHKSILKSDTILLVCHSSSIDVSFGIYEWERHKLSILILHDIFK